ncbi:MAG: hypothetical protein SOX97_07110 [Sutterella sp.]|nr:hypothetical protein [Sutterella sp.]
MENPEPPTITVGIVVKQTLQFALDSTKNQSCFSSETVVSQGRDDESFIKRRYRPEQPAKRLKETDERK